MSSLIKFLLFGGGNMGAAFVRGILRADLASASEILVLEPRHERRVWLGENLGCATGSPGDPVSLDSRAILLLAVKPQDFAQASRVIEGLIAPDRLVVSCMAGISFSAISSHLGGHTRIVRCMPNLPVEIGMGVVGYIAARDLDNEQLDFLKRLFAALGCAIQLASEEMIDAITALSGSGPGVIAYLLEHFVDAGINLGFAPEVAQRLALATLGGTVALLEATKFPPLLLRQQVTSPNGTTAAAIATLDQCEVGAAIKGAIASAFRRARELGARS